MKDWKEWFKSENREDRYQAYKARLIEEGFIEANPKRWVKPDKNDVLWHFSDKGIGGDEAEKFWDYYESIDWYTKGKVRIKSWKGRANTWIKNNEKYKRSDSGKTRKLSVAEQVAAGIASRENENATSPKESGQIVADYG